MDDGLTPETLALLVEGHARFLAFLDRRVGDRAAAEDLLQHAYVKAVERGDSLRDGESATAWFYRLLRNALVDHYRRRGAERRALDAVARESDDRHDPELMAAICQCVTPLIDTLDAGYADLLRRVDLDGQAVADVARDAGITANNARVRLHRARKALHRQLVISCGTCATHGCLDCGCTTECS